jgi:FkbM family methyltransferase
VIRNTSLHRLYHDARTWHFRNFVLSRLETVELHGVTLGMTGISVAMQEALSQGRYEQVEVQLCRDVLSPSDTVVEIGSAIGFLGIFAMKHLGVVEYRSIEANSQTAELLAANYVRNGLVADVVVAALAAADGPVALSVGADFWTNTTVRPDEQTSPSMWVRGCTLATLLADVPFEPSTLIVDVEGAETCLNGNRLPESVKKLIIELHPALIGAPAAFEVLKQLMNQGFYVRATLDTTYVLCR